MNIISSQYTYRPIRIIHIHMHYTVIYIPGVVYKPSIYIYIPAATYKQ